MELAIDEQLNNQALRIQQNEARKQQAKTQVASQATDAVKKQTVRVAKQAVLRTINLAFAASLIGIVVTWAIMSVQIFVGNLLGVKAIALEGIELAIYAGLSFLMFIFFALIFILLSFVSDPWSVATMTLEAVGNWLTGK